MAYCAKEDLLTGDIPLAGKYGDGTAFVNFAADEIDSQIGHIYITPVVFDESTPAKVASVRPSKLLLKKINILLASGRIILDMAAGGEDQQLHAYGLSMLQEAIGLLTKLSEGKIDLIDAPLLPSTDDDLNNAVSIANEDPVSLVETFYTQRQGTWPIGARPLSIVFYDEEPIEEVVP